MSVYTEEEAKAKWCPFARQMVSIDGGIGGPVMGFSANRFEGNAVSLCIGSGCMAWRWFDDIDEVGMVKKYEVKTRTYSRSVQAATEERRGSCGLAGKP